MGLRALAALPVGYALAALATAALARHLPLDADQAVLAATMASFAIFAAVAIWAFAARGQRRLWAGIGLAAAGAGLLAIL
ncbi:iron transporter [Zavarzinia aquatilis]|uniref:Iron transporter n=1 Tax=Zavarzinia aquatilis TaxID=2211142 RepID=A0A317EG10_9PROT|nr:iron transporter [Zavarzinia aquatilis]